MTDILIKGMKMPQNCDECSLAKMESEFHGICTAIRNDVCYVYPDKGKPGWCPLVEVPTHGRLIDADELRKDLFHRRCGVTFANKEVWDALESAPTVIEASEDGEQDGKL